MVGWIYSLFRGKSLQIAQVIVLAVVLIFSYISYEIYVDHNPEYPWSSKRVLGMEMAGYFSSLDTFAAFGFPYSREWRDIGRWFEDLRTDNDVVLVTNEKSEIADFYLPSKVKDRIKYSSRTFPGDVRAPHGLYILIVQKPQSSRYRLWGVDLDKWHEKFVSLHDFTNEEGEIVASVYFLTSQQIESEFH
jgi:hypothetical protein